MYISTSQCILLEIHSVNFEINQTSEYTHSVEQRTSNKGLHYSSTLRSLSDSCVTLLLVTVSMCINNGPMTPDKILKRELHSTRHAQACSSTSLRRHNYHSRSYNDRGNRRNRKARAFEDFISERRSYRVDSDIVNTSMSCTVY